MYVAQYIFTCLLAASALGGILGYLLHWLFSRGQATTLATRMSDEWSGKLDLVNGEKSNLAMQLKTAEGGLTDWKNKFAGVEGEHKTLLGKFADLSAKIPVLETAVAGWVAKSALWDTDKSKLQLDLKACADARGKLETDLAGWTSKGAAWDTQRASLDAEWNGKLAAANDEKSKLTAQITALQNDHSHLKASFADVQGKIGPLEGLVAGWVAKSATWDGDRNRLQGDLKLAGDARSKLEVETKELSARLSSTEAQLRKSIADDKADDSAYERTIADLRLKLSATEIEWSQKLVAANHDKAGLQARLTSTESEHGKLRMGFAEVQSKIGPLEGAVAGWVAKSATWDHERANLSAQLAKSIADDKADDSAYEKTIADLRGKLSALEIEKTKHQAGVTDLTARLNSTHAQLQKAIADDQADDAASEKTISELKAREAAQERTLSNLMDEWAARGKTWEAREVDYTSRLQAAQVQLANAAMYERTATDLRGRVVSLEQDWNLRYNALETEHAGCATRYAALETKLAAPPLAMAAAAAGGTFSTTPATIQTKLTQAGGDIEDIEGIGPFYGGKLRAIGIHWIHELLDAGKDLAGRASIIERTGIERHLILKWVNHADLLRVKGVTPDWAELLEASGVDTVKELRNRVPANLQKKMEETNPTNGNGRYAPTVPDLATVTRWVELAKQMDPKLTY